MIGIISIPDYLRNWFKFVLHNNIVRVFSMHNVSNNTVNVEFLTCTYILLFSTIIYYLIYVNMYIRVVLLY